MIVHPSFPVNDGTLEPGKKLVRVLISAFAWWTQGVMNQIILISANPHQSFGVERGPAPLVYFQFGHGNHNVRVQNGARYLIFLPIAGMSCDCFLAVEDSTVKLFRLAAIQGTALVEINHYDAGWIPLELALARRHVPGFYERNARLAPIIS